MFEPREIRWKEAWRKLHNETLHYKHSSPSIIRIIRSTTVEQAGHAARIDPKRNSYRVLVGILAGRRTLGRPRRRWRIILR
jgi:hypothetical protein